MTVRPRLRWQRVVPLGATFVGLLLWYGQTFLPRTVVFNTSGSMPKGLYRIAPVAEVGVKAGDIVLIEMTPALQELSKRYPWLPSRVPLLKHIAALPGDRVCATEEELFINGVPVRKIEKTDQSGAPLPQLKGCHSVRAGEFLPLGDPRAEHSFDGRYFGEVPLGAILGKARLVYAF